MTVSELIAALQGLPQDLPAIVWDEDGPCDVSHVAVRDLAIEPRTVVEIL